MESIIAWILSFMVLVAPPGRQTFYPEAQETTEAAMVRYESIAHDIVDVVYDSNTKPLFKGSDGRARTVSILLALMLHESGFMKNVDEGTGKFGRGDGGKSWCLLQMNVGLGRTLTWNTKFDRLPKMGDPKEDLTQGVTGLEMVQDRKLCIREGLKMLRVSFNSCPGLPLDQKLRMYGSGSCDKGAKPSAVRMHTAIKFWDQSKEKRSAFKDVDIMALVDAEHTQLSQEDQLVTVTESGFPILKVVHPN